MLSLGEAQLLKGDTTAMLLSRGGTFRSVSHVLADLLTSPFEGILLPPFDLS